MEYKKIMQMNVYTKQKQTRRRSKQTYGYQKVEGEREEQIVVWD